MSRTGIFFVTVIIAMVLATISQFMIYKHIEPAQAAGQATAFLLMGWILVGLAYLLSGRRWARVTLVKAVIVVSIICAALATYGGLSP